MDFKYELKNKISIYLQNFYIITISDFAGGVKCEKVVVILCYNFKMKKVILLLLIYILAIVPAWAKRLYPEKTYQARWCKAKGGIMEYKLNDQTRVDCLLPTMAVEFDFANKWAECIGQALYYGQKTNRTPACVLIIEDPEKDLKYLKRLRYTVYNKKKIPQFRTFTVKPVFQVTEKEYFD